MTGATLRPRGLAPLIALLTLVCMPAWTVPAAAQGAQEVVVLELYGKPFEDQLVRDALAMAMPDDNDRAITEAGAKGLLLLFPEQDGVFRDQERRELFETPEGLLAEAAEHGFRLEGDPATAREIIEKYEVVGQEISLFHRPELQQLAEAVEDYLSKIGLNVDANPINWPSARAKAMAESSVGRIAAVLSVVGKEVVPRPDGQPQVQVEVVQAEPQVPQPPGPELIEWREVVLWMLAALAVPVVLLLMVHWRSRRRSGVKRLDVLLAGHPDAAFAAHPTAPPVALRVGFRITADAG